MRLRRLPLHVTDTIQKLHDALLHLTPQVTVPEDLRAQAEKPLLRMLELSS